MKKAIALILALVMLLALCTACASKEEPAGPKTETTDTKKEDTKTENPGTSSAETSKKEYEVYEEKVAEKNLTPQGTDYADMDALKALAANDKDREITVALNVDWTDISPFGYDKGGKNWMAPAYNGFIASSEVFGATFEQFKPDLAKRMEKIDEMTYEFELYDYIHDSLGNHITANDAKFCLETIGSSADYQRIKNSLDYVEVVDDYTFRVHLKSNDFGAIEFILLKTPVVSQKWYEAADDTERVMYPIGCGPYKISDHVTASYVEFVPVEDYWQTDVEARSAWQFQTFDKVTFKLIKDDSVRAVALQTGEVDFVKNVNDADIGLFYDMATGEPKEGYNVYQCYDGKVNVLAFNMWPGNVLDNEDLRKAICYAIDQETLMLAYGKDYNSAQTPHDVVAMSASDYNTDWDSEPYYDQDIEKAKEHLEAAGYKPGELTLRVVARNNLPGNEPMLVAMQAMLQEIGINLELQLLEQAVITEMIYTTDQWDMIVESVYTNDVCANGYAYLFDNRSYNYGTRYHTVDDELQKLVEASVNMETYGPESRDAVHEYVMDHAICYALYSYGWWHVGVDGITGVITKSDGNLNPANFIVSEDYTDGQN